MGILLTDLGILARERGEDAQGEEYLRKAQPLVQEVNTPLLLAYHAQAWGEWYL
jgi:hypothetical protein